MLRVKRVVSGDSANGNTGIAINMYVVPIVRACERRDQGVHRTRS